MTVLQKSGIGVMIVGLLVPAVTYLVAQSMLAVKAQEGGPPDQGAMVVAYLIMVGSCGIGLLVFLVGVGLLIAGAWRARKQHQEPIAT